MHHIIAIHCTARLMPHLMPHASLLTPHASHITHHTLCIVLGLCIMHCDGASCAHSQACINALLLLHQNTAGCKARASPHHSAGVSTSDSGAVWSKYAKKVTAAPYPDCKPSFPSSAASPILLACTICLGCHQHRIYNCDAKKTWDQAFDTITRRVDKNLILIDSRRTICCNWQRAAGCPSRTHNSHHLCSRCGKPTHGAQNCPWVQCA